VLSGAVDLSKCNISHTSTAELLQKCPTSCSGKCALNKRSLFSMAEFSKRALKKQTVLWIITTERETCKITHSKQEVEEISI